MIDFLISNRKNLQYENGIWNCHKLNDNYRLYYHNARLFQLEGNRELILIGDCINEGKVKNIKEITDVINILKGNFYAFLVAENDFHITSSAFGLLPVYYLNNYSLISSSVALISKTSSTILTENKKWIINQLLFNYQFGTDTFFNEIKIFPAMSYLHIDHQKKSFTKYYSIQNEFVDSPQNWEKSIDKLSNYFIKVAKEYIPDKDSVISFTGGFDGRTLVAIATHFNKEFTAFSYGKIENDDVSIPLLNSKELGIPYFWLNLDKEYSEKQYLNSSIEYIENTNGANGLLYAHVDYSAKKVKEKSEYLISGACGSELFRSAYTSGAVTSKALIELFSFDNYEEFKKAVITSEVFKYIDFQEYEHEINDVIESGWKYKMDLPTKLSRNGKLYVFVYEEIFRKFFGAWITSQMKYVNVRTPFIDFDFFKQIIETELCGAYSDFLTENPLKRLKGQVLYADVIKKTNKSMYNIKTGKGYSPRVVREPILRPLLILPFLRKRLSRKIIHTDLDNLGIISGAKEYFSKLKAQENCKYFDSLVLDLEALSSNIREAERDTLLSTISLLIYKNKIYE